MALVNEATGARYEVAEGEHTVGRGPWLQITDKRVSRDHAVLRAEKGSLALCPKHKNPCYYAKVGGAKLSPLCKDVWQELHNGDMFSLLPSDLVFKVVMKEEEKKVGTQKVDHVKKQAECISSDDVLFGPSDGNMLHPPLKSAVPDDHTHKEGPVGVVTDDNTHKEGPVGVVPDDHTQKECPAAEPADARSEGFTSEPMHTAGRQSSEDDQSEKPMQPVSKVVGVFQNSVGSTKRPRTLPSWLANIAVETKPPAKKKMKKDGSPISPTARPPVKKQVTAKKEGGAKPKEEGVKPKEKGVKPKEEGVKPKKSEMLASGSYEELKPHPSPEPAPKSVKADDKTATIPGPTSGVSKLPTPVGSKTPEEPPSLPICPYGDKCYRKNPAHFREYSHPSVATPSEASVATPSDDLDADSEKPECPYGSDCYRQNPAHRAEYRHEEAAPKPRPKRQHAKRSTKASVLEGDSDDDDQPNTYDYTDSFIDDDNGGGGDDSSSYGDNDEDMDWAPDESSEDVVELLSDAKSFLTNKKLHKPT